MKKLRNLIIMILALFGVVGFYALDVNAAPSTITLKKKSDLYYFTEDKKTDYLYGYNFYRKELTDGTLVYCVNNIDTEAPAGKTLNLVGEITDNGLKFLLASRQTMGSFTGNVNKDYYVIQSAIWEYFDETRGTNNWGKHTFKESDTGMKKLVYNLVTLAKQARNNPVESASLNIIVVNKGMTLNGDYYVSDPIRVNTTGTNGDYAVSLEGAPAGTIIKGVDGTVKSSFKNGEEFRVYVPASTKTSGSLKVKAGAVGTMLKAYQYTTGKSKLQDIGLVVTEPVSATGEVSLNYDVITTKLKISKQDITSKEELAGATLIITNSNGTEVAKWVSTTEPHYIEGLEPGNYKLTEKIAPKGYVLSSSTINFTLERDGKVKTVVMYNELEKKEVTKLKISKQDITNKQELAGATLIITNSKGTEVAKWVSTTEPHYIEGLAAGDYTLTEKIAPKGYVLSEETIKFTLQADGKVKTVVMYNELEKKEVTKLKISKQDITSKEELPGATLVIKDSKGTEVAKWVSTNEPHYIEGLAEGKYTLTETIAPKGYILSSSTIEFTLKADGKVETVIMYNSREEITRVKISKQDITSKEELPGATLVVKDSDGNVVDTWVSTNEPHYIEGLKEGKYTLTEITAPDGYKLSEETIEFTLKADGKVESVVMYNAKYNVPITDLNVSTGVLIGAVVLMLLGSGIVFYEKHSH